jgi:hypothetical protein
MIKSSLFSIRNFFHKVKEIMLINKITHTSVGVDYANFQMNPAIRMCGSIVTLSRSEWSVAPGVEMLRCDSG